MHINPPLPDHTRKTAAKLRKGMTDAERALWFRLRGGRLGGLKFRRQHPVPPYIVDFYCGDAGLVVELDGSQHAPNVDTVRSEALQKRGLLILRFWDNQVLTDMGAVLSEIVRVAHTRTLTHPFGAPSPEGRGEKNGPSLLDEGETHEGAQA